MSAFKDLTGLKFGRLTVLAQEKTKSGSRAYWRCKCDCGNETVVAGCDLKRGHTQSCGCSSGNFKNLTGMRFGRLTVIERAENQGKRTMWLCRCDCGVQIVVRGDTLKSGQQSCGCLHRENVRLLGTKNIKHGRIRERAYKIWQGIKYRCLNPNCHAYKNYGGRGITMYPAWVNDFQSFYDYVSKLPHFGEEGYTLDRINNNGDYEPDNLRWADNRTQQRNTRRNIIVDYNGQSMTLVEAAEKSGVQFGTLYRRLKAGETGEYLFRLPISKNRK